MNEPLVFKRRPKPNAPPTTVTSQALVLPSPPPPPPRLTDPAEIPLPTPVLDHTFLPHIFDKIFAYAPLRSLHVLRGTSPAMHRRCSVRLYKYIWVHVPPGGGVEILARVPDCCDAHNKAHTMRLPGLKCDLSASAREIDATRFRISTYTTMVDVDFTPPLGYNIPWDRATIAVLAELLDGRPIIRRLDKHSLKGRQADIGGLWAEKIATVPSLKVTMEVVYLNLQAYVDNEHTIPADWCSAVIMAATAEVAMLVLDIPNNGSMIAQLSARSVPFVFTNAPGVVLVLSGGAASTPFLDATTDILPFLSVLLGHFLQTSLFKSVADWPIIFIGPIEAFDHTFFRDGVSDEDKGHELLKRLLHSDDDVDNDVSEWSEFRKALRHIVHFVPLAELESYTGLHWETISTTPKARHVA